MNERSVRDTGGGERFRTGETEQKRTTVMLNCESCGAVISTEAPYDKCPSCHAPGSNLHRVTERRVRD